MRNTTMNEKADSSICPICTNCFPVGEIESHSSKCIFAKPESSSVKRKRSVSPSDSMHRYQRKKSPAFNGSDSINISLPKLVIPKRIEDFIGQEHVLGESTMLYRMIKEGEIPNMILWGPPGCGKTSLASIIKQICRVNPSKYAAYYSLNGTQCSTKEFQKVSTLASKDIKDGKKSVVFMDEIGKFIKRQEEVILAPIEQGEIVLIGATSEGLSKEIKLLLSHCRLVNFDKLSASELVQILKKAAKTMGIDVFRKGERNEFKDNRTYIEESALEWLGDSSCGDAKMALNYFEMIQKYFGHEGKVITYYDAKEGVKKSRHEKNSNEYHNLLTAMHKSIRGSNADAALYWATRLLMSGVSSHIITRRLVSVACEDVGLADPQAFQLAVSTMNGCQMVGTPESDVLVAQCVVYLARAPKSREIESTLGKAKTLIAEQRGNQPNVPIHLTNTSPKQMKDLGYGKPGDYAGFMPEQLQDVRFL